MTTSKRVIQGVVLKKAGDKTATVLVERKVMHPRYRKYLVHDEANQTQIGDVISAIECRPLSKNKAFRLYKVVKKGVE